MKIELTKEEKQELETLHKRERDRRVADRIKAVLLFSEGWTQLQISQALRLRPETIHDHLEDYRRSRKLKPENGGSAPHLSAGQMEAVTDHLEANTYLKVGDICAYIQKTYGVTFTVSGMTKWLHHHKFSYKHLNRGGARPTP
jgi:transposase